MTTYFRYQIGQYSLEEMQNYTSEDGGDTRWRRKAVSKACDSVTGLSVTPFTARRRMRGRSRRANRSVEIYDGRRIYPTEPVARHSYSEWQAKVADGSAYEYEYEA